MKTSKAAILIGLISLMLLVSSCGEPEPEGQCPPSCDDGNPCTADSCSKDTRFMCLNSQVPGCDPACGAPCPGSAGRYMTMQCDKELMKCVADVSPTAKISPTPLLLEQTSLGFGFRIEILMNQPFNMQSDLFKMDISVASFPTGVSSVKIKKAEFSGQNPARQTVIIGRKDINRHIYDTSSIITEEMKIDFPTADFDGTFTALKLSMTYEYEQEAYGQVQTKEQTIQIQVRGQNFEWLKPTSKPKCPDSCDDGNPATEDVCDASTDYFCEHKAIAGQCGNAICESSEDKCTCEADCGPCSGDASSSLGYQCSSDSKCVTVLKPGLSQEPVSIFDDRNLNIFHLQNTVSFNNPLNVKTDKITAEFTLFSAQEAYQDIKINSVKIMEREKTFASSDPGKAFSSAGSSIPVELTVTGFAGTEEEKSLSINVWYEYNILSGNTTIPRSGNFAKGIGKITLINPTG